jgi:Tfp pilus assembly protein PilO
MAAKGGKDFLGELARKPLQVKLGVLGGVLAVLGVLYWQFFYSSLADEQRELSVQRTKLVKQEKTLKDREKEWIELLQKKELLDAQLKKNQVSLPASSELPAFFVHLQKQAAAAGVTVVRWERLKEKDVETFVRVPVSIKLTGTFYQINNYFRLLSQTDRIISVVSLKLKDGKQKNDEIILSGEFEAVTYRQRDQPPDTSLSDEARPDAPPAEGKPQGSKLLRGRSTGQAEAKGDKAQSAAGQGGQQ